MIKKLIKERSRCTHIRSLYVDGITIKNSNGVVNLMNDYFCSVDDKLSKEIPDIEIIF